MAEARALLQRERADGPPTGPTDLPASTAATIQAATSD
jgi:hypothetical protein